MCSYKNISRSVSHIAVAETVEDVEEIWSGLLLSHSLKPSQISWFPLEIDADIALRERGIVPIAPTEVLSIEDRRRIFLDAVEWSIHWLDGIGLDNEKIIFKPELSLSDIVKDRIYYYFDHIFYLITVLEEIVKRLRPETLIFSSNRPETVGGIDHTEEYYLRRLGRCVAQKHNTRILEIDTKAPAVLKGRWFQRRANKYIGMIREITFSILNYRAYKNSAFPLNADIKKKLNGKKVLVLGKGSSNPFWRLDHLCRFLEENEICHTVPLFYSRDEYNQRQKGVYLSQGRGRVKSSAEFLELKARIQPMLRKKKLFTRIIYNGINLNDFFEQKLFWILTEYLPEYWSDYLILSKLLTEADFDLLLGAAYMSADSGFLAALHCFENAGIPTLLIPHGVQFCRYPEKDEMKKAYNFIFPLYYSHVAVVGEYVRNKLTECSVKERNVRCTGNLEPLNSKRIYDWSKIIFRQVFGLSSRKKIIVYFLGRATRSFHMSYVNISFDELRNAIYDVRRVANRIGCQLVIKPHPAFLNAEEWIHSWDPKDDYRIITETAANSVLLSIADIIITSKSSIAIEALNYEIPIILFEHEQRDLVFFEELASPLRTFDQERLRPFIRATGFEELLQTCKAILYDADVQQSFQSKCNAAVPWICHNQDGQQVKRIIEFMCDIIEDNYNLITKG